MTGQSWSIVVTLMSGTCQGMQYTATYAFPATSNSSHGHLVTVMSSLGQLITGQLITGAFLYPPSEWSELARYQVMLAFPSVHPSVRPSVCEHRVQSRRTEPKVVTLLRPDRGSNL